MDSLDIFHQFLTEDLPFFSEPTFEIQSLPGGTLSVTTPLDSMTISHMCELLDAPLYLRSLILNPPRNTMIFLQKKEEISDSLCWFISKTSEMRDLERVAFTLDLSEHEHFLELLQNLPQLRRLELLAPATFILTAETDDFQRRLIIGIERAVEGLQRLNELVIPAALAIGTFVELLDRMFESNLMLSGSRFHYFHRARNLLDETPSMFLPGA